MDDQPPAPSSEPLVQTARKKRTGLWVVLAIVIVLVGGLAIFGVIRIATGIAPFISTITGSAQKNSDYGERVAAFAAEKKTAAVGETLQFGPLSLKVTSAGQGYTPTPSEVEYIQGTALYKGSGKTATEQRKSRGLDLADTNAHYVQIRAAAQYDAQKKPNLTMDGSFQESLASATLNGTLPVIWYVNDTAANIYGPTDDAAATIASGEPFELIYLYRIPKEAATGELRLSITIYTKVSSIVGTEGMPRGTYDYSLQLW